jgi:hypothetical protein
MRRANSAPRTLVAATLTSAAIALTLSGTSSSLAKDAAPSRVFPVLTHPSERQSLVKISPGSLLSSVPVEAPVTGSTELKD